MMSDRYRRRRRLAILIAVLSVGLLLIGYAFGFFLETYSHPRIEPTDDGFQLLHQAHSTELQDAQSVLLQLDAKLRLKDRFKLHGDCRDAFLEGDETFLYFPRRYAVVKNNQTVRGAEYPEQPWPVLAATRDEKSGDVWLFGASAGRIVYRRRVGAQFTEPADAGAAPGEMEDLIAMAGPSVAWRVKGETVVHSLRWNGARFEPWADLPTGGSDHVGAAAVGKRFLLLTHHREDRAYGKVRLRLTCCPGCGEPPPPDRITFNDPLLLLGRRITGLAAAPSGEGIAILVTRSTALHAAVLPRLDATDARLVSVASEPMWRRSVAQIWPLLMLFFSFSLILLGFTLLRERREFLLEAVGPPAAGPETAEILQRAMAYVIDFMVLLPVFFVTVEVLSLAPETATLELTDPRAVVMFGAFAAIQFVYFFVQESLFGRTIGKRVIGLRVCAEEGGRPGWRKSLVRNLLRLVDATYVLAFLGVGFMMFTSKRQRLGDLIARTVVVQDEK